MKLGDITAWFRGKLRPRRRGIERVTRSAGETRSGSGIGNSDTGPISAAAHDRPTQLSEVDAFSHKDYARAAAGALVAADKTFTLGLFGDWGTGKTTIIGGIGEAVVTQSLGFVAFDVWRFEGDALRRQFLREVAQQLKRQGQLPWSYRPEHELRDLDVDVPVVSDRLRLSPWALLRAIIIGSVIGILLWAFLRSGFPQTIFGRRAKGSTAQEAGFIVGAIVFAYGLLSQILVVEQRAITVQRIEEPERFYRKFIDLLVRVKAKRVVVAIDNLDRCSPSLVDEMLATIKTYLEPAQDERIKKSWWFRHPVLAAKHVRGQQFADAVFVIAADDAAVRRHLTAREIERLPPNAGLQTSADEARQRVDEYLRKFFDASIRLRPILPEDIRRFAADELSGLFDYVRATLPVDADADEVLSQTIEERVVSLVVSALRSNPRRIKQFRNSLETRLRTIRERELSGGIPRSEGISVDLLGVAKLAIIEEEWPEFYRELEKNTRRLAEAQTAVVTADVHGPRLSSFLRDTRDITPKNVGAVVNLKLAEDELELPGYGAYRDAVAYGELTVAGRIVADADPHLQRRYADRLPILFDNELKRSGIPEARNVLAAALGGPPLGLPNERDRQRILSDAINQPDLLTQLPLLNAHDVFESMRLLSEEERVRARAPFLDLSVVGSQSGPEGVEAVSVELAEIVVELTPSERERLLTPLTVEPTASQYRANYLPLIRADATLLSEQGVQSAWQSLSARFDEQSPEFEVVTLGFSVGLGPNLLTDFMNRLNQLFADVVQEPARHARVYRAIASSLRSMESPPDNELQALLTTIDSNFGALIASDSTAAAKFALEVADRVIRYGSRAPQSAAAATQLAVTATQQAPLEVAQLLTLDEPV